MSSMHTRVIISRIHRLGFVTEAVDFGIPWTPDLAVAAEHPKVVEQRDRMERRAAMNVGQQVRVDFREAW